jgi:hypothetical protein
MMLPHQPISDNDGDSTQQLPGRAGVMIYTSGNRIHLPSGLARRARRSITDHLARLFAFMRGTVTTTVQPTRLTTDERGTIQRAAGLVGVTMSEIMRLAALEYAAKRVSF